MLRIFLIIAILASIGTIVLTQLHGRKQIQTVMEARDENIKGRGDEKSQKEKTQKELAGTKDILQQTKDSLAKTEEDLNNNKQQLASAQANVQKLDTDLKAAVTARTQAQQDLSKWSQLNMTPEQVLETKTSLAKAQDLAKVLEVENQMCVRSREEWKNKYLVLTGGEDYSPELPSGTKGKVVAVDPKWNFVVLDIGKSKGILERGVLMVHRNSQYLGKVRISEVLDNRCIANVMPGVTLGEIQEGDQVLY